VTGDDTNMWDHALNRRKEKASGNQRKDETLISLHSR
jgi:hypothetical protein